MSTPRNFQDIFPAEVVAVQGKPYLFTNLRVDRSTVPEKLHAYDVADDCDGEFWRIQSTVLVNHWCTVIGLEPIALGEDGKYHCEPKEDNPCASSEGRFVGFSMKDQSEYVVWYHTLKKYAKSTQNQGGKS